MPPFPRPFNPTPSRPAEPVPSAAEASPQQLADADAAPGTPEGPSSSATPSETPASGRLPDDGLDPPAEEEAAIFTTDAEEAAGPDDIDVGEDEDLDDLADLDDDEDLDDLDDEDDLDDLEDEVDLDDLDDDDEPGSFRSAVTSEIARRAELSLLKGMEGVADTFEETAHRLGRIARMRGGPEALTLGPVHSTVGWLEGAADYLRTSDLEAVGSDLRHRVRTRPVQSLGIALCTGWLLGRILR